MKNQHEIAFRGWLVFSAFVLLGLGVFGRILWIQSAEHEQWTAIGERFESSVRSIEPSRGQIYASNGSVLATSVPVYEVRWDTQSEAIQWGQFDQALDSLCQGLSRILNDRSASEYRKLLRSGRNSGRRNVLIARRATYLEQKDLVKLPFIRRGRFKSGFTFTRNEVRRRPFGDLAGRTVGIDRNENRVGLEGSWNESLAGVTGKQLQRRISGGDWMPVSDEYIIEPKAGLDVISTIDMHLQDVASRALEKQLLNHNAAWGTVILMEVATGKIRAMANLTREGNGDGEEQPSYYESYNHAIGTAVEPGSTFKLASLMAAMEAGGVQPEDLVDTGNGVVTFHGRKMSDSNADEGGNGSINLEQIFALSSNVGTALTVKNAFNENPQKFLDALDRIGVSQPTGVLLNGEAEPKVYKTAGEDRWSKISLTQMAIGYELTQTPLQTLTLFNAVANNGAMVRPLLVESTEHNGQTIALFETETVQDNICSPSTLATCKRMLRSVADPEGSGTAQYVFAKSPYRVAGKTGTARIAGPNGYDGRYRASFAGYFPAEAPRYSCIVVIADTQSGAYYGSTIACPVFRDVANKVYATDPTFHHTTTGPLAKSPHLPGSKDGAKLDLIALCEALGLPFTDEGESDWVTVNTSPDIATLSERLLEPHNVPDVRGMGLRDALYLLENAGLTVKSEGSGTVRRQSIRPGTELRARQTINLELS